MSSYAVRVRKSGFLVRMVRVKDCYPEGQIDHWVHGDKSNCLRLGEAEAIALAARLNAAFGQAGYEFDVMVEVPVPRWRPLTEAAEGRHA